MAHIRRSKVADDPKPFIADFKDAELKKRVQVPCATEREAQDLLARDCSWKDRKGKGVTLAQLVFSFLRRYSSPVYAGRSASGITRNLNRHIVPELGTMLAVNVRPTHIQQLALNLRKTHQITTVRGIMRQLKTCYRDAIAAGYLKSEPVTEGMKELEGYRTPQRARDLPVRIVDAILSHATPLQRLVTLLMADTGFVPKEIAALKWDCFILGSRPTASVRLVLDGDELKAPTKTATARTVKMTPRLGEALDAYRQSLKTLQLPHNLLFEKESGVPASEAIIRRHLEQVTKAAGVTCSALDLRYHAAAKWIAEGASIVALAARLGLGDTLRVAKTFRLMFRARPRPQRMGLVSKFLFGDAVPGSSATQPSSR